MKRNSYPLISTPEFRKIKTQKEFVPTEDSPIITTENKNGEENSSFFSFSKNNCSYREINQCSSKKESSGSNKNSEKTIKDLLGKESESHTSRKSKDSSREMTNKTSEIISGKNNPSSKYNSRNYGKMTFNNTATLLKQKIKTLPNTTNSNSKRTKITQNSNTGKKDVEKHQKTSEYKRHSSPKIKISNRNATSFMENNRTTTVKNNTTAKSIKSINRNENILNKNNSLSNMSNKEIKAKNISEDFPVNNFVYISNLSNKKQPTVVSDFSNYQKKKINLNNTNQEANIIENNNIGNNSFEEKMKDIADKLKELTSIVLVQAESQKNLDNNLSQVMYSLNQYLIDHSYYDQKLDYYLEQQFDINEKLREFLDNANQ